MTKNTNIGNFGTFVAIFIPITTTKTLLNYVKIHQELGISLGMM